MHIKTKLLYTVILVCSLALLLIKGVQYAILGSYFPIFIFLAITTLFYINKKKKKTLNIILKVWSIIIIAWSLLRIIIGLTDRFGKELMENHIQENLGSKGLIISLLFLIAGFFLLNKKRRKQWLG